MKGHKYSKKDGKRSRSVVPPQTLEEFLALPEAEQELWDKKGQAVTAVRDGSSAAAAERKYELKRGTLRGLGRSVLRKGKNGRYFARGIDHLLRVIPILTPDGRVEIGVPDSKQASLLGKYWNAVQRYEQMGDLSALTKFEEKHVVDANGKEWPLLTDPNELDRLASAGVLSFETFYTRAA